MKKKLILLGVLLVVGAVLILPQAKTYAASGFTKISTIKAFLRANQTNKVLNYVGSTIKVGPFASEYNIISKTDFASGYLKAYRYRPIYAKAWTVEKWNNNFWGIQDAKKTQKRGLIVARLIDKNTNQLVKTYGENKVFMFLAVKKNNKVKIIACLESTEGILKDYFKIIE